MKECVTIVLFPDDSFGFFANPIGSSEVTKGSRFFECPDDLPIIEVCDWISKGYSHPKIKERVSS